MKRKLVYWSIFVGFLIALGYASTYAGGKQPNDLLYRYSTAVESGVAYLVMLGVVLVIAGRDRELLALRRPESWLRSLGLALLVFVVAWIAIQFLLDPFLHGGREQGLVPKHWRSQYEGAYAANWFVVAVMAPVVEELTFRGLGYSLISIRFGMWAGIVATGMLFAGSHGLAQAFPELAVLGFGLAWLRQRTDSVYPGMIVHGTFNSIALAAVFFS